MSGEQERAFACPLFFLLITRLWSVVAMSLLASRPRSEVVVKMTE